MINYKFPEEKPFLLHYASVLGRSDIESILQTDTIADSKQAQSLAQFIWQLTDQVILDVKAGKSVNGDSDLAAMNEYVFDTIRAALYNNGYSAEWEEGSDKA